MKIIFIIHPEDDACSRCKSAAYVNGENPDDGYNIHVAAPDTFRAVGIVHKNCRCRAEVLDGEVDSIREQEFLDRVTVDARDKLPLNPDQLGGAVVHDLGKTTIPYKPGRHLTRAITYHHRTRRNPGNIFFTLVARPLVSLYNFLLGRKRD